MLDGEPIKKDVSVHVSILSAPAFATGGVIFCVIFTSLVAVQPFAILVTVTV